MFSVCTNFSFIFKITLNKKARSFNNFQSYWLKWKSVCLSLSLKRYAFMYLWGSIKFYTFWCTFWQTYYLHVLLDLGNNSQSSWKMFNLNRLEERMIPYAIWLMALLCFLLSCIKLFDTNRDNGMSFWSSPASQSNSISMPCSSLHPLCNSKWCCVIICKK